ncbi:MAG: MBL fold metallo-hydrolase [Rhodocyclaceae bacterium]|nr:MBL fold metallo-hydrolase [Rhodocyclaceae bacterium]
MDILTDHGSGIYAIDSGFGRPFMDAVHLVVEGGRCAIVDTAVNDSVPRVLDTLAFLDIPRDRVDYVILTHVHLDHAGGAGSLMRELPDARLVVHPRGARHMIDPSKLVQATYQVYGEASARRMYGEIPPIPAERVIEATEGLAIELAGRPLHFLDTPGHARHHVCIRDGATGHVFSGDTFGFGFVELRREGREFIFPTLTPTQFDPDDLHRSVDRIAALEPGAVYVTHYSRMNDVPRLAADLHRLIDAHARAGRNAHADGSGRRSRLTAAIADIIREESETQGWALTGEAAVDFMRPDIELNATGIECWLDAR